MEHAGGSGVELSVGIKMEASGDQAATLGNKFCCNFREEPNWKPCDCQHRVVCWQKKTKFTRL